MVEENTSIEAEKTRFRIWLVRILIALVVLAGIVWLAHPFYRRFKERRSQAASHRAQTTRICRTPMRRLRLLASRR